MTFDEHYISYLPIFVLTVIIEHMVKYLKVHKREKFFGSDFEFFTIL